MKRKPWSKPLAIMLTVAIVLMTMSSLTFAQIRGAIFTTAEDGGTNINHFPSKEAVHLNGGPTKPGAAGLPGGNYYVQITEPNGTILGTSVGSSNETPILVTNGSFAYPYKLHDILIKASDGTQGYDTTTNEGGVYKVWVSQSSNFSPSASKTDNFKVGDETQEPTTGTIRVFKFYDHNGDGIFNGDDYGIEGWEITVTGTNTNMTRLTDSNGYASFAYLEEGHYTVTEEDVEGWVATTGLIRENVMVEIGQTTTVQFGNREETTLVVHKDFIGEGEAFKQTDFPVTLTPLTSSEPVATVLLENTTEGTLSGTIRYGNPWTITETNGLQPGVQYLITEDDLVRCRLDNVTADGDAVVECDEELAAWIVTVPANGEGSITLFNNCTTDPTKGTLIVRKELQGGSAARKFGVTIRNGDDVVVETGEFSKNEPAEFTLEPGTYTVSEDTPYPAYYSLVGYSPSNVVEIEAGEIVTVTITNRYNPPDNGGPEYGTLRVVKVLENEVGSTTQLFNITLKTDAGTVVRTGQVSAGSAAEFNNLTPGWYTVSEDTPLPAGYSLDGYSPTSGRVYVSANDTVTVTITNSFSPDDGEDETTFELEQEDPLVGEEEVEFPAELPAVGEGPTLPKTTGTDLLVFGFGIALATGGFVLRRRKRK